MDLPVATQWSILDRVLAYDRTFAARSEDGIVVGILYQSAFWPSRQAFEEIQSTSAESATGVLATEELRVVGIEASTTLDLSERLEAEGVDLLYIAPVRASDIVAAVRAATDLRIPTFTGVRDFLGAGVGLGVGQRGGRPEILVNLPVTRAQGMDLDAQFLRLVTMITSGREDDRTD
jgi:ABC-type sugar transport system substrate-binding protein